MTCGKSWCAPSRALVAAALALASLVPLAGCSDAPDDGDAEATAADADQAELDRLRALPYSGFARTSQGDRSGVVLRDEDVSQPGYTLYTTFGMSRADLVDEEGAVVRSWTVSPSASWGNCELMRNGDLMVTGLENVPAGSGRYLMRLDWEGNVLWKHTVDAHHDVEEQPDGSLLAPTYEKQQVARFSKSVPTRVDHLTWFDAGGTQLRTLSLLDVLSKDPKAFAFRRVAAKRGLPREGKWVDLFHVNTARTMRRAELADRHPLYAVGNVLVTIRHQDVIVVIDPQTEELVWKWGRGELSGPHHAHVLESGNLLIFDNGLAPTRQWSRVIELDPVAERIVWEYRAPVRTDFFTLGRGSAQRQPNGNTLIAESDGGRGFEVTSEGRIVWEFVNPHRDRKGRPASIVRMRRYPRERIEAIERAK